MGDVLFPIDLWLFYAVNHGMANPVFDAVMPFITEVKNWYVVYAGLFVWLLWKGGPRGRWCALVLALTILISDPLNSRLIKELIVRVRPCSALADVRLLVNCGAGKSFPSSHAVNNIAAAVVLGYFFRKWTPYVLAIASAVSFSRIYVGVHYPSDVIGGAIEGALIAGLVIWGWKSLYTFYSYRYFSPPNSGGVDRKSPKPVSSTNTKRRLRP